jgi:hypothetical protein
MIAEYEQRGASGRCARSSAIRYPTTVAPRDVRVARRHHTYAGDAAAF